MGLRETAPTGGAWAARALIRELPRWAWGLASLTVALLALDYALEVGVFGVGAAQANLDEAIYLVLIWGAAAIAIAGAAVRRDLSGWGLVAAGLVLWGLGELYNQFWFDPINGAYPSLQDYLYFGFYALVIAGLLILGRRGRREGWALPALITPILGLATLWWWFAIDPVSGTLEGDTAARLTTIAYPALDLLMACTALMALAALGWRAGPSLLLVIAGAVVVGIVDSVYASEVAKGSIGDQTAIDSLWPTGALLMAAAPWLADRESSAEPSESRIELVFALSAIAVALVVLVWDHYDRFSSVAVVLATLTLVAAGGRLILLYYEAVQARRRAVAAERERGWIETLHAGSVDAALDCIISVDREGTVVEWNPAATRTFGFSKDQVLYENLADLIVPPDVRDAYRETFQRLVDGGARSLIGRRTEWIAQRSDGSRIPIELSVNRTDTDPPTYTAFIRDISERKHQEQERERMASIVRSSEDGMISVSPDGTVIAWNPAAEKIFGYAPEEILGSNIRVLVPPDRLAEHLGILETVRSGESVRTETRRVTKHGEPVDIAVQVFPVRDEMGRMTGYSAVLRDITDRRARERERQRHRERQAWLNQIEEVLEQDGFEFARQPVLDLGTGRIARHELLIRMRMDGELVLPGRFLPHAEGSPLMRRIDRWAIRRGIQLAVERPVAINLSATSLNDSGVVPAVEAALRKTGANAHDISFEITETAAVEDLEAARSLVSALRSLGCGVSLDDFGTGYGSFTYLARLEVSRLKIDMSFIQRLTASREDQQVVRSIVAVARNFGLTTVGEGVEDQATLELLRNMGVDMAQGYLIGRPSEAWLEDHDVTAALRPVRT